MKPRILELFCCSGGSAVGYERAGFDVVGVELFPEFAEFWPKRMPIVFRDAIEAVDELLAGGAILDTASRIWTLDDFDAVHGSPQCQRFCAISKGTNGGKFDHPDFTTPTRDRFDALNALGIPTVMENPASRQDIMLCGLMFPAGSDGLSVLRHRKFELGGWTMSQPPHPRHTGHVKGWRHGECFPGDDWDDGRLVVACYGHGGGKANTREAQAAMGIDWVTKKDVLNEMLPPAYTEYVGEHLMRHLEKNP